MFIHSEIVRRVLEILVLFPVGGRRFSEGTSADREIQRTLMEVTEAPKHHSAALFVDWI